ncbi:MAG: hypothetical protein HUU41_09145 [Bryobacteraceae bacterium]|nr:hypothetical protein [Bryobacterales bacterium]NUN01267.1 hypothetical protein [Bryobacteraceae bacterium]
MNRRLFCSMLPVAPSALAADLASVDYRRVATRILQPLKLHRGERVLARFDPEYFAELVPLLRKSVRSAGAVWLEPLRAATPVSAASVERVDVFLRLPLGTSARALDPAEERHLVDWVDRGGTRRELHFHWSDGTRHPDGLPAVHPPEFDALYMRALNIDHQALRAVQDRAIRVLRMGTVRIQSPNGTDVMFRIAKRPFNVQDGDASAERVQAARVRVDRHIELPAGVVRVAPVEDSAFGSIGLPEARFGDTVAKGVVILLDNGRVTGVRAKEGLDAVKAALAAGGDAAMRFREFGLGCNPALAVPEGSGLIPYYGYGAGVVRLSLGDNEELGGKVRGGFVRWFFLPDTTLHVDFRYLVRNGKLTVPET